MGSYLESEQSSIAGLSNAVGLEAKDPSFVAAAKRQNMMSAIKLGDERNWHLNLMTSLDNWSFWPKPEEDLQLA